MAVPPDFTILDLTGKFVLNKPLSDDTDAILSLQGVSWLTRRVISYATITLAIKHYKDESGVEHIDIDQTFTGGIPGTSEQRTLWWKERQHSDYIFGHVVGKSRRCKAEDLHDEFLTKGWTEDTYQHGLVQSYVESDTPRSGTTWIADQTWGVENVDNERRYTRHIHFTGPEGQMIRARLVYDYLKYNDLPAGGASFIMQDASSSSHPESSTFKDNTDTYTEDVYQTGEVEHGNSQLDDHETWYMRCRARLWRRLPHTYKKLERIALYIRGPRPKVDLPEPKPLLDRHHQYRFLRFSLTLESAFINITRPFSSPWLFLIFGMAYIVGFAFFSRAQSFITPADSYIGCTSTYWLAKDGCGLDGNLCGPFNDGTFDFRCPSRCDNVILQNPRTVGDEKVAYVPLIVGGGDDNRTYRGDSFICAAAIQAGIIRNSGGGCASLQLMSNFTNFLPYSANGLTSIGFPTVFPVSFRFNRSTSLSHCEDLRDPALAFNVIVTFLLFVIFRPVPIIRFWCLVCIGFWHVALFSQPQGPPPQISVAFGTFLPALFVAYVFWRTAFRFTLPVFSKAPIEAAILYLTPFWIGVLNNLTFDRLPLSRLTASDFTKRQGAVTVLVVILVIFTIVVINQARIIRKTGWLPFYAGWYILGGLVVMVVALLPGTQLRLHHYIVAMILVPGTGFPTRLSALYQGLLLGLFLNGTAAFGFASIVQTATELRQDAPIGTLFPTFLTSSTNYNTSIPFSEQTISWAPLSRGWDGYVLLVDDVERYVGAATNYSLAALNASLPHFFRLAYTINGTSGDFTMAAVLWPNGTWVDPRPGPS
ncbi:hypothetical protein AX15_000876 [Amanita polypyramis BW_CC]|nr:hypothetical protein AX15_000876 [Amanita polypyramis BW_CC]